MADKSVIDRFWPKVEKGPDCWDWTGSRDSSGYGNMGIGSRTDGTRATISTHRLSWEIHVGPIPKNLHVLHECDNPSCVRPSHLWLGTHKENVEDSRLKGRRNRPIGEKNGRVKLNEADVLAIRNDSRIARLVADDYGVCKSSIWDIRSGRRGLWSHVK